MLMILVAIVAALYALHIYCQHCAQVEYVKDIPGPKGIPIFGNLFQLLKTTDELFTLSREWARTFKGTYRFRILRKGIVNLARPEDVEVLLSSRRNIDKSNIYDFLHPWLNDGLLTSTGDKWQSRRKILTPSFHFNILQQFVTIFGEQSNVLVDKLKKEEKKETDIVPFVTEFALHAICETAMGTTLDAKSSGAQKYKNSIYKIGELLIYQLGRPWFHSPLIWNLTEKGKEMQKVLGNLHSFTRQVITERKKNFVEIAPVSNEEVEVIGNSKKRLAMLDLLLSANANGEKIDENGIREEVDTFMFEGHDTTSMGIIYALMCLANNPEIQERVYEELKDIFGDSKEPPSIQELQQMRYLEMCVKETLRIYPSVPFISRVLSEPLKLAKYSIPAGHTVHVQIYDLHHMPDLYPDPEKFDPERFLPENCVSRHPFAYIPFSAGPRNCIGQKFAMLEEKAVISTILRNYKLEAVTRPEELEFFIDLVLRTKTPIKIKFVPRI